MIWLLACCSDRTWQLYNMNCQNLASVFTGDGVKLAQTLTGCCLSSLPCQLLKLTWKSEQTEQHGPSFKAWTENEFMPFLQALTTLPFVKYVSCKLLYIIIGFQVYHSSAQ